MPGTERLFAYPQCQTSALNERGVILPPVAQVVCGLASLPSHTLRLTSSPPARLFVQQSHDTVEQGTDLLEDVAVRRAMDHSDTLLIFLLKGRRKERYAERQEHTGKDGGPITLRQWLDEHSGKT
jgi:hypothetical protein